jgi:hypothetical protein
MYPTLTLKFDYISNSALSNPTQIPSTLLKQNIKVTHNVGCKNLFLFFILLKTFSPKLVRPQLSNIKFKMFPAPHLKNNIINLLRAPYKNKLARNQLYLPKFKISFSVQFYLDTKLPEMGGITARTPDAFIILLNHLRTNLIFLETNILYLNKLVFLIRLPIAYFWNYNKVAKY